MNLKKVLKITGIVVGVLFGLWIIGGLIYASMSAYSGYKWQKQTDEYMAALEKPYREDTYGGKTPEETWSLFLTALRQGDAELASKYFMPEKREEWRNTLVKTKESDNFKEVLGNLPSNLTKDVVTSERESYSYYSYTFYSKEMKSNVNNSVVFWHNPYTRVWKISTL